MTVLDHVLDTPAPTRPVSGRAAGLLADESAHVAHNYHPLEVVVSHGSGAVLVDVDGTEYLDFLAAYSATNFGHANPRLLAAALGDRLAPGAARPANSLVPNEA